MSLKRLQLPLSIIGSTIFTLCFTAVVHAKTPSHVYQQVDYIVADIQAIRQKQNVNDNAREPGIQIAKTPLHVYTKGLELFEKVERFKKANNWPSVAPPGLPTQKASPADVLELMTEIQKEINDIKQRLGVNRSGDIALIPGKTPSDVYENVWRASLLMDGLVGAIKPNYVYRNTQRIIAGLDTIAAKMNKSITKPAASKPTGKKPIDANTEGFKVLYQLVELERKLGLKPLRVPSFPAGDITPSDVYDTTNSILAELTRINIQQGLPAVPDKSLANTKITPNEVVAQMQVIQGMLDQLVR